MSRAVSSKFIEVMRYDETDEALVAFVRITHPDYATPLYICNYNATLTDPNGPIYATTSQGQQYVYLPFGFTLPEESDAEPVMQIVVDGVSRVLSPLLGSVTTPAKVRIHLALASTPNQIEMSLPQFDLGRAQVDAGRVTLSLAIDAMVSEPYPGGDFTPAAFGGLWSTT